MTKRLLFLLTLLFTLTVSVPALSRTLSSSDGSFWVDLPAGFGPASDPPANTILAVEVPGSGISLFAQKGDPVEMDPTEYADRQKRMLFDNGAQIHGTTTSTLAERPACSFLVAGVAQGKESLFVFNQRQNAVYVFVLNYPVGQRQKAAGLWDQIAPTLKFAKN
ncbi:MAG: hypothetical protein WC314_06350 [Vulcanimicrobiota bacterium]